MILAMADGHRDGSDKKTLIVGLTDVDIHRLREGMPIPVDGRAVEQPERDLLLIAASSDEALIRHVREGAKNAGTAFSPDATPPPDADDREALLNFVLAGAERLGLVVAYPPKVEDGRISCGDCGEAILRSEAVGWLHVGGVHGCRHGEGCAHPLLHLVEPPPKPTKEGTTPE